MYNIYMYDILGPYLVQTFRNERDSTDSYVGVEMKPTYYS